MTPPTAVRQTCDEHGWYVAGCPGCAEAKREYRASLRGDAPDLLTKDDAPCCLAKRDAAGRLPVGYCSPTCERRPK